jgi:asparagine synthase (glutamine-hydrolysing)
MCGIVGLIQSKPTNVRNLTLSMLGQIEHRGPDATGIWNSENVGLGNARLAIVGLSLLQNQPMTMGDHTLVFNGEIYNYREVRNELKLLGRIFTDGSDTEVVLQAFLEWGIGSFLKFNGMWAIAIYDHMDAKLYLSRDRLGVKPLYWTSDSKNFGFSSEIKGLLSLIPSRDINLGYFSQAIFNNVADQGTESPLSQVEQVAPGTVLIVSRDFSISIKDWWKFQPSLQLEASPKTSEQFREVFEDAVRIRIPTDVSYGFSLSGGLDSTAVFGCAATNDFFGTKPLGVFNLAYSGGFMNESPSARETTRLFEKQLEVFVAKPEELLNRISRVVWSQEGIGWNPSILAYDFYYSHLQDAGIKVIIEGHGPDEILGGYPGMVIEFLLQNPLLRNPGDILPLLKMANSSGNPEVGERLLTNDRELVTNFLRGYIKSKLQDSKFVTTHRKRTHSSIFSEKLSISQHNSSEIYPFPAGSFKSVLFKHATHKTLPQVLRVFDRASMAHGIESRSPFLDYRLFELAMSMPDSFLLSKKHMKPMVRETLGEYIPSHILKNREKRGFGAPIGRILSSESIRKYLMSSEMKSNFRSAQCINGEELIKLLETEKSEYSPLELKEIWQAVTFAIWQKQFL